MRGLIILALGLLSLGAAQAALPPGTKLASSKPTAEQQTQLAGMSIPFIENAGQVAAEVAFYAQIFAGSAFVTREGALVLSLPGAEQAGPMQGEQEPRPRGTGWTLVETPVTEVELQPRGDAPAVAQVASFIGNDTTQWRNTLKTYNAVQLGQPWPGVDYQVQAHGGSVERIFTVQPGAKAEAIRMAVAGAERLSVESGALVAHTGNGAVQLSAPVAWQVIEGAKHSVQVAYVLEDTRYGFTLGDYDPAQPVIIDPLLQSTYLGGSGDDYARALALGADGSVYVAGHADSTNFPGVTGGAQSTYGGGADAFIARLNPNLTQLHQATYLGGSDLDIANALALGADGSVYVAGQANSTNFPGTTGGVQPTHGGNNDAFIARLNPNLTQLHQATYLGGSNNNYAHALALGVDGSVYVAGQTNSTNFPGVTGGVQPTLGGGNADAFVAHLNPNLTQLHQATYLGGSGGDRVYALALGADGSVYVAGYTTSTNFPGTTGGAQPTHGGSEDAFIARLNPNLTQLHQATYLGGSSNELAQALALGADGSVYVAGQTRSSNFPGVTGGAQPTYGGNTDAFIARLNPNLTQLYQATYLGGSNIDFVYYALALGADGSVYVAGYTTSTNFPGTTGGAQSTHGGSLDVFIARLNPNLTQLHQATYLGGSGTRPLA